MFRTIICFLILTSLLPLKSASQLSFRPTGGERPKIKEGYVLPQNFYNQHKGIMCKKEDQLQKKIGLPLVVRLGSKTYVDYLEQKPNATWVRP